MAPDTPIPAVLSGRRPPRAGGLGTASVALALLALAAAPPLLAQSQERASRVTGRVVDKTTGSAIPGAEVVARSLGSSLAGERTSAAERTAAGELRVVADDRGRFELDGVPPGPHSLRVRMFGYGPLDDTVDISAESWIEIDVQLTPEALELAPLMVVVRRPISQEMRGFYERRRHYGGGDFVTREEIEGLDPGRLTDLLRRYPGLNVVPERRWGGSVSYQVIMRGRCRPALFIDGAPVFNTLIDETLAPHDIEGIEIYRGPETPTRFSRTPCGALVVWTRTGERARQSASGRTSVLRKVLLAGGMVGLLGLLSSL